MTASTSPPSPAAEPRVLQAAGRRFALLRAKVRVAIWTEAGAIALLALVGYALVTYTIDRNLRLELPFRAAVLGVFAVWLCRSSWRRLRPLFVRLDDDEMALAVERQLPSLREALISSMQFERAIGGGRNPRESRELMRQVVADVQGRLSTLPFERALDGRRMGRFTGTVVACALAFLAWGVFDGGSMRLWALRNLALSSVEWPRYTQLGFVDAGDGVVRLPQGDPLTVRVAVLSGPVPDQMFLRSDYASGETAVEPMSRTGDGEFTLTMETLLEDVRLVAEGGDGLTSVLSVEIVERPRIEDVAIEVVFPAYMEKAPEVVPPTEGEVRILRGSELRVTGRSHKPIAEAFLLLADVKIPLTVGDGDHGFRGALEPEAGGLLVIDVIDRDQLGAGSPPKLLVRIVDDQEPHVDFKLRGISSLVTAQVRIPGALKLKDDFGLTAVGAEIRAIDDSPDGLEPRAPDAAPPPEVPFTPVPAAYGDGLIQGAVLLETTATVDIKQLNPAEDENDPTNVVRPGMLLSLRFTARDNYGPGEPHTAVGETFTFRVVTRDKLVDELRRRQVEQRMELQRIRDDEEAALLSLRETMSPRAEDPRAAQARLQFKTLAARQQALGRRVAFVGDLYQRILWEYENNRIWEPGKVREYESLTSVPLAALAREAFPTTAHAVGVFADTGDEELRASAIEGYVDILARLQAIIEVMEQVETLAALIEQLRGVIKVEDTAIREVERRLQEAGANVFGDKGQGADPPPGKDGDKDPDKDHE